MKMKIGRSVFTSAEDRFLFPSRHLFICLRHVKYAQEQHHIYGKEEARYIIEPPHRACPVESATICEIVLGKTFYLSQSQSVSSRIPHVVLSSGW